MRLPASPIDLVMEHVRGQMVCPRRVLELLLRPGLRRVRRVRGSPVGSRHTAACSAARRAGSQPRVEARPGRLKFTQPSVRGSCPGRHGIGIRMHCTLCALSSGAGSPPIGQIGTQLGSSGAGSASARSAGGGSWPGRQWACSPVPAPARARRAPVERPRPGRGYRAPAIPPAVPVPAAASAAHMRPTPTRQPRARRRTGAVPRDVEQSCPWVPPVR